MRSLSPSRHQKKVCQLLLVAFLFSLTTGVRVQVHAQQTAEQANALLAASQTQNLTNHQQALQTALEALAIFNNLGDQQGKAEAKFLIGKYQTALGTLADAKTTYEESHQLYQSVQDIPGVFASLIGLNIVAQRQGDWVTALQYLGQAELLATVDSPPSRRALMANSLADLYRANGLPVIARTEYERARDYFLQMQPPDTRSANRSKMLIGYTYLLEENYTDAAIHLNEALASLTYDLDKANCHEYLGRVHIGLQQYDEALQRLETALESYEAAHNATEAARVLALIAQINEQQGALAQARTRYRDALQRFQTIGDRVNESAVNFSLGKLELKASNLKQAEKYLKSSLETTEELRRASIANDLTTAYSATVHERYQTYIECLVRKNKLRPSQRLHIEAFQISELARARSLAELLRYNPPAAGPHQELAKQERSLRQTLGERISARIRLLGEMATKPKDREQLRARLPALETAIQEARHAHGKVAAELRQVDPLFAQIQQPTAYSLEQIQREVIDDDQTVLLEFMLGDEASYAWAVRKNDFKFYELKNRTTINNAADALYKLSANKPDGDTEQRIKQAGAELTKLVLEPLKEQLNARRLIIVADGALHYVPFQMLPVPANENEPLVTNYEIVNTPSASILGQLRKEKQQRQPTKRLLAAFGDPVFPANYAEFKGSGSGELLASAKPNALEPWRRAARDIEIAADNVDASMLQPLTFSKFELQKLSDLGGATAMIARGFEASRENLMRTNLSDFSVLHFATHGVLDPKDPEVTGFFLSMVDDSGRPQNGFITTPDIYALHAPVDLVVLSACRTGLGKGVRGEGLIGLTSGFMHAGASSVAASLWKVDDNATAHLMEHFYINLLQNNMPPAEALRAAQNVLRQDQRWQSPHYWAGFTLQGEYQNTIRIPPPAPLPAPSPANTSRTVQYVIGAAVLSVLLLGGIGWIYWRSRGRRTAGRS